MEKRKRYIDNKYDLNTIDINEIKSKILKQIQIKEELFDKKYPPNINKSIDSLGKQQFDTSFYTGTGGNIYLYWRQYLFYKKSSKYLNKFKEALETNLNVLNKTKKNDSNSFFMGDSGIYLFCCIFGIETNNKQYFTKYFNELIDLKKLGDNQNSELELLYGITGYLYSLLFLKKYLMTKEHSFKTEEKKLDSTIKDLFLEIIQKGIKNQSQYKWNNCLVYPFPLNDKYSYFYLGAAHGLIGVIYILLCAICIYRDLINSSEIQKKYKYDVIIENVLLINLNYIKSLQLENGNFPDDIEGQDYDDKVHFCHGCVGAVFLFSLAEKIFPDNNFNEVAKKCNKCLWERGILYKGNGVCHGISGICYALMNLYNNSDNILFLKESVALCSATFDPKIQKLVSEYSDPQRKKKGTPDTPFSLMEGDGGLLIMYYDLISLLEKDQDPMTKILPGYELY